MSTHWVDTRALLVKALLAPVRAALDSGLGHETELILASRSG